MLIDTNDLVAATDFNRNTGKYTSLAAEGRRIVILKDQKLVAALIGIHDLNRLDALDSAADLGFDDIPDIPDNDITDDRDTKPSEPPSSVVLPIGLTAGGVPAQINPREHLLVVGRGASELMGVLLTRAAAATPVEDVQHFVIGAGTPTVMLPSTPADTPTPVILGITTDSTIRGEQRLADQITGELHRRLTLLREHTVNTVEQYRQMHPAAAPVDHLTVILDGADALLSGPLMAPVSEIIRRGTDLGMNVWLFSEVPPTAPVMRMAAISQRIALHMPTGYQSREVIGSDAAAHLKPHQAFLHTGNQSLTPVVTPTATPPLTPATPTAPPALQWPAPPQPEPVETLVNRWQASDDHPTEPAVPIGVIDDVANHRHLLYALRFPQGGLTNVITVNTHDSEFVQTLLIAASLADSAARLRFHYLGTRPLPTTATVTSQSLDDLREASDGAANAVLTALTAAAGQEHTAVCVINMIELDVMGNWPPTFSATSAADRRFWLEPIVTTVLSTALQQGAHVVLLSKDLLRLTATLRHAPPSTTAIYGAGVDSTLVGRNLREQMRNISSVPDPAHHAIATAGGHLLNENTGAHLVLAQATL